MGKVAQLTHNTSCDSTGKLVEYDWHVNDSKLFLYDHLMCGATSQCGDR